MKRVLVVGNSLQVGRTEELYARGFRSHGCEVATCVFEDIWLVRQQNSRASRLAMRVARPAFLRVFNKKVKAAGESFQPDLVFALDAKLLDPVTVGRLKQLAPIFLFCTDNPLDAHHTHRNAWQANSMAMWDSVLIWSHALVEQLKNSGIRLPVYHPFCCDSEFLFPQPQDRPEYDVVFPANWDDSGKREEYLQAISHVRLGIWGTKDWVRRARVDLRKFYVAMNRYTDLPRLFGSGRIAINLMRPQNMMGHNLRNFEIVACGTLMLTERTPEMHGLFREDEQAIFFSSPTELREKVDWVLDHPDHAGRIAANGFALTKRNGIEVRIKEIESLWHQVAANERSMAIAAHG